MTRLIGLFFAEKKSVQINYAIYYENIWMNILFFTENYNYKLYKSFDEGFPKLKAQLSLEALQMGGWG